MKKTINFGRFESMKIPTNQLTNLVGGTTTAGGTWYNTNQTIACGETISFTYTSDTVEGNTTTYNGSANRRVACE